MVSYVDASKKVSDCSACRDTELLTRSGLSSPTSRVVVGEEVAVLCMMMAILLTYGVLKSKLFRVKGA